MPSLKEKHFSRFHTNICTLLFVIIFQVNIWSAVKSIHASPYSHIHFIINFEEHYFKCKHDLWDHMLPLSPFPVLLFVPKHSVHLITGDGVTANTHPLNPVNHDVCDYSDLATAKPDVLDGAVARPGEMHFRSQLMGFTHAQVGGLPCKHQLAKPQHFHHLHSDKHRVLQGADRQWSTGFHSTGCLESRTELN